MKTATEFILEQAGFDIAGPDIWGKAIGELTAFIEVSAEQSLAWLWNPEAEVFVGPKLVIRGEPEAAVRNALFQLQALLAEDDDNQDVPRSFPAVTETSTAPALVD